MKKRISKLQSFKFDILTNWQDKATEKSMILSKFLALVILYSDSIVHLLMRPSGFWWCFEPEV